MAANTKGPPDGGWGWMCVMGKMICYFCGLGTPAAFGVIYIDLIEYFDTTREVAAWIGSLSFGLTFLAGPLSSALISRFGIQKTCAAGTLIAFSGCFISWFANEIPYLYVSYGLVMGIGLSLVVISSTLVVMQYFKGRVALASGIGSIGEGIGTLVLPPLYTYLMEEYGWRGTLLLLSGIVLNCLIGAVIFIQPPFLKLTTDTPSKNSMSASFNNYISFLRDPCQLVSIIRMALTFLGYTVPFVHLPDLAQQMDIDKHQAAYLVSIMGVSSIVGRVGFGWISDFQCVNVIVLQGVLLVVCGVATAVCPHLTAFYAFAVYAAIYGAFMGGNISLMPVSLFMLVGLDRCGDAFGIHTFTAGSVGTVASPFAGWLFDTTHSYNVSFYMAGSSFLCCGVMSGLMVVLHRKAMEGAKTEMVHTVSQ